MSITSAHLVNVPRTPAETGDLSPDELVEQGRALLDWIAAYLSSPERYPVVSRSQPGDVRRSLPGAPPVTGESLASIFADFESKILPGITHWNQPGFFAYFSISASVPGILGELLTAALVVNAMLWKTSPAATELEELTLDWLRQLLGLEAGWFGMITDTASISSMYALAAAREAKPELAIRDRGMAGRTDLPRLRVYASEHSHSSIDKAALALGFGLENVVHVGADAEFRMRPDLLERAIAEDRGRGWLPVACVATVGTTSITSIDPVSAIADICEREKIWLHVDGAYGGMAAIIPERRSVLAGARRRGREGSSDVTGLRPRHDGVAFRRREVSRDPVEKHPSLLYQLVRRQVARFTGSSRDVDQVGGSDRHL